MALESPNNASLVSVSPSDCLVFKLERNAASKVILRVSNVSSYKVVFKVKTTQPSWYYVKPNQQILDVGQSEDVAIVLVETESNRFLDQLASNEPEKLDKHRFLVQSKALQSDEFNRLKGLSAVQRTDEYTKIWDVQRDEKKNIKLRVEFQYPEPESSSSQQHVYASTSRAAGSAASETNANVGLGRPTSSLAQNVENVRSKLAKLNSTISEAGSTAGNAAAAPEAVRNELEGLKKKYDAIVEYTVHLTAERDTMVAQLEEAQRELSREIAAKKRVGHGGADKDQSAGGKVGLKGDKSDKKTIQKGYSFLVLFVAVIISFAIGRYFR